MTLAPICLFTYNRPDHTRKTLESLQQNTLAKDSEIYIYSDAPRNSADENLVSQVRAHLKTVKGFRKIHLIEQPKNLGLANSIIAGVTSVLETSDRVIVLEDDLVTSPFFLTFMNDALELFKSRKLVATIQGYLYPYKNQPKENFFLTGADSWGWATWKRAWSHFEPNGKKLLAEIEKKKLTYSFDLDGSYAHTQMLKDQIAGKNNSWAIRWQAVCYLKGMVSYYPHATLVANIGLDGSGEHCSPDTNFDVKLHSKKISVTDIFPKESAAMRSELVRFHKSIRRTLSVKIKDRLSREYRRLFKNSHLTSR